MQIDFSKSEVTFKFDDGTEYNFTTTNRSVMNKAQIIKEDLELLSRTYDKFDEFYRDLIENITTDIYDKDKFFDTSIEYAKDLVRLRTSNDVSRFCDVTKKTKNSIFLCEQEVLQLLELIAVIKIYSFLIHADEIKRTKVLDTFIRDVSILYQEPATQIYKIIKSRTYRFKLDDSSKMNYLKYMFKFEFLIQYNFDFILMSLLPVYDWNRNPLSFIVSLASDNMNFLVMTYAQLPLEFIEDIEIDSTNLIDSISYDLVLNSIQKFVEKTLQSKGQSLKVHLYPSQITELICLPLISLAVDIPVSYLIRKPNSTKFILQYMAQYIASKTKIKTFMGEGYKLLPYAYEEPVNPLLSPSPVSLEVLKMNPLFYQLDTKQPLLRFVSKLSTLEKRKKNLRHIVNLSDAEGISNITDACKGLVTFVTNMFDDKSRESIASISRKCVLSCISSEIAESAKIKSSQHLEQMI